MGKRLFTTAPVRAIGDKRLTALELRVLLAISARDGMSSVKGSGAGCFASSATLAQDAQTDISNLSKAISRLAKLGYLAREKQQMDRRRHTLRVLFDQGDSWRTDQASSGQIVGETTNDRVEIVGDPTTETPEIVGNDTSENGENPPQTAPHYTPLRGELNSVETEELDSAEAAHRAVCATRRPRDDDPDNVLAFPSGDAPSEAPDRLGSDAAATQALRLPANFGNLEGSAQVSIIDRELKRLDWFALHEQDQAMIEQMLFTIADDFSGEQTGHHAQRLYEALP